MNPILRVIFLIIGIVISGMGQTPDTKKTDGHPAACPIEGDKGVIAQTTDAKTVVKKGRPINWDKINSNKLAQLMKDSKIMKDQLATIIAHDKVLDQKVDNNSALLVALTNFATTAFAYNTSLVASIVPQTSYVYSLMLYATPVFVTILFLVGLLIIAYYLFMMAWGFISERRADRRRERERRTTIAGAETATA